MNNINQTMSIISLSLYDVIYEYCILNLILPAFAEYNVIIKTNEQEIETDIAIITKAY